MPTPKPHSIPPPPLVPFRNHKFVFEVCESDLKEYIDILNYKPPLLKTASNLHGDKHRICVLTPKTTVRLQAHDYQQNGALSSPPLLTHIYKSGTLSPVRRIPGS